MYKLDKDKFKNSLGMFNVVEAFNTIKEEGSCLGEDVLFSIFFLGIFLLSIIFSPFIIIYAFLVSLQR